MNKKRVVITGAGLVSPAGLTLEENWSKMVTGQIAIERISDFDVSSLPVKLAGKVKGFIPDNYIKKKKNLRFMRKDVQYCMAAARLAVEDSHLDFDTIDPTRVGLFVGSGNSEGKYNKHFPALNHSLNENGDIDPEKLGAIGLRKIYPFFMILDLMNTGFCYFSVDTGIQGINNTFSCGLSGGYAIGEAFKAIRQGETAVAIAGGHDSIISCFENYFFYSATPWVTQSEKPLEAMKPYSPQRDGFVLGEGAGFVVLEDLESALKRNAPIRGELVGYGCGCDLNDDLMNPDPRGEGLLLAMQKALDDAKIDPDCIGYVNSEGIATQESDLSETRAFKRLWGKKSYHIPISTIKPIIGFPGSAACAIDLIATLLALEKGTLPPTVNHRGGDPECDLDYIPNKCRKKDIQYALSTNLGLGGQNCAFILKKFSPGR